MFEKDEVGDAIRLSATPMGHKPTPEKAPSTQEAVLPLRAFPHGNLISSALAGASSREVPIDQRKDARTLKSGTDFRGLSVRAEIGRL